MNKSNFSVKRKIILSHMHITIRFQWETVWVQVPSGAPKKIHHRVCIFLPLNLKKKTSPTGKPVGVLVIG